MTYSRESLELITRVILASAEVIREEEVAKLNGERVEMAEKLEETKDEAYQEGYAEAEEECEGNYESGREDGYSDGWDEGHDEGYDEGYEEAKDVYCTEEEEE